jgi:tRNA (guanine37-N1)-methyltransferase
MLGKAAERGLVSFELHDIRAHATDKHRTADETPYGGGEGMLLKADVLYAAWAAVVPEKKPGVRTILMSPQGARFTAAKAKELAKYSELVFVCGHYEGVDERFIDECVDEELSIGDYVLTGGELPAMVIADAVARWVPGVVGKEGSVSKDSHENGLLKYPQFTRPADFRGRKVPDVLTSGNHAAIEKWRLEQSEERTKRKRPDLYDSYIANKPAGGKKK